MKVLYKPFSIVIGVLSGLLAGMLFKRIWSLVARQDEAPSATQANRSWPEILIAAAIEGAVYAVVKAATDRSGAVAVEKATGVWPGPE